MNKTCPNNHKHTSKVGYTEDIEWCKTCGAMRSIIPGDPPGEWRYPELRKW